MAVEMALLPVANPKLQSKSERSPTKSTATAQIESLDQHQCNRCGGGTTHHQAGEDRRNDLERAIRRISETTTTVARPFRGAAVGRSPSAAFSPVTNSRQEKAVGSPVAMLQRHRQIFRPVRLSRQRWRLHRARSRHQRETMRQPAPTGTGCRAPKDGCARRSWLAI
jgi:hypothetical protein